MRLSIIVAAHNEGEALAKTVQSCIETCAGLDHEIVVADDASWDGSVDELERRFPRLRVVRNLERLGPSPTKDRGARAAAGEILIFLDGHTKPEPGALRRMAEDVQRLQGRAVVAPTVVALDVDRWRNAAVASGHGYRVDLEAFRSTWLPLAALRVVQEGPRKFYESPAAIGCALAVTRELYETLWGFDPEMRSWGVEDVDFGLKCWLMGHPILHDPEAVVGHRFQRSFDHYHVAPEHLLANQIRLARKNFTHSAWETWVERRREQHAEALPEHPEGLWAHAWQVFESRRGSVEEERSYLMARRVRDEFWYAERFGLTWPRLGTAATPGSEPPTGTGAKAASVARTFAPSPSPPPPPPPDQPGCPVPGQPTDSSSCPCGGGGGASGGSGAPGGGMLRSFGIPSWSVNLFSLNLVISDTPAFYAPGLGPQVAWDLTYNSVNPNDPADVGPFDYLFGPNISCPYLAHVVDLGDVVHIVMPDGRTDWYYPTNLGSNPVDYAPAATTGVFNILTKDTTSNLFTLALADRSATYTFGKPFTSGGVNYYAITKNADPFGQALAFAYSADPMPKLLTLTDANGNTSQVVYNANGQASQINDPFGGNAQFGYTNVNGQNLLSAITDQADYTSLLGYDAQGRLTSITTPVTAPNPTWRFAYAGTGGEVASVTDPYGNARSYTATATTTTLTDQLGHTTTYDFSNNAFGGAGTITDALGNQTRQTFDDDRNLTQVINARGYFSRYTYDDNGNRLTQADYLNLYPSTSASIHRSWTYDGNNNVLSATDPLGTQSWTYNANNQPLTWTDKLGHTASYTYSGLGQLLTVTDRNGITAVTNTYGSSGRIATTTDALGGTTSFNWDNRGRQTQVTDPAGNATAFAYDLLDRVTAITFPDQTTIQNAYNCCQRTQITDQLNSVTKFVYDDLGRLTQTTDPTGAVTNTAYDAVGNRTSLTDPDSHAWQWQYDALNRRTTQIDPLRNQETWSYDAVGNRTKRVDGNNAATTYTYDALNRLTQTAYPDGSFASMTYDAVGNRLTATDALGSWVWTYNANSWMSSAQSPLASGATQYQYDNEGNRTQLTDPDGNATTTGYDQAYRVISVGFSVNGQNQTVSYQSDPRGLTINRTLPNGVVSAYGYDSLGQMTSIQHAQSGGTTLFSFAYQYDGAGNLAQETSQRWDTGLNATVAHQANYTYDARYQLTTEKYDQAGNFALELDYTYDPAGNRTKLVTTDPTTADSPVTVASTYAADNQIAQAVRTSPIDPTQTTTYAEDGNGSLTQAANSATGTTAYSYDFERRLTKVGLPNGTAAQFAYDTDDLRAQKTGISGAVTNYVLDGLQVLLEKSSTGITQIRYVPGLARIVSGSVGYYLEDRLGSIVGLTDGNGNVTDTFRYDTWGNPLQQQGSTNPAYQWVGEEGYYLNPDAGLYLMGVRHYSPRMGRFLTRDPIEFSGGTNLYGYVGNGPTNHTDRYGLLRDCAQEQIDCVRRCLRGPIPFPWNRGGKSGKWARYRYCESTCFAAYTACLAANAAENACRAVQDAGNWIANHPYAVVGTIVVIGGVAFIVATGGAGAPVVLLAL